MLGVCHRETMACRRMKIRYAARTDLGMKRGHNEDCYAILEEECLVLVADGMGGHSSGEVASGLATVEIGEFYHRTQEDPDSELPFEMPVELTPVERRLVCGFKLANLRIFEAATADQGRRGMGTTLVAAAVADSQVCIAHVGDSRAYRIRGGAITPLTRDHSLLEQFKEINPEMTKEEQERFPHKNVITRALGLNESVEVDIKTHDLQESDLYILCSDGLSGMVSDDEMLEVAQESPTIEKAVATLVERANEAGGSDNITVVMLQCAAG
jgi:serine/threonine protein phosphatase PrpC